MSGNESTYNTIDEYILLDPPEIQLRLQALRKTIKEAAPQAVEKISWRMPTFAMKTNLIHFAVHKKHIGIYPGASGIEKFRDRFAGYVSSKGAVQFPLDEPLPFELISDIVRFRVAEDLQAAEDKAAKKK
ncbi:MAG: hypothetical protein HGA22_11140 [Clostridiales bacterium]|nr:hypothetical protein [Clostridiales bacterium]